MPTERGGATVSRMHRLPRSFVLVLITLVTLVTGLAASQLPASATTYPLTGGATTTGGGGHSCSLMVNGRVRCWGYNLHNELGGGSADLQEARAVLVQNPQGTGPLTGAIQV